jgi:hypothetical protein
VCAATSEDIDHPLSGWTIWQTIQMREHMVIVLTQNGQLSTYCVTPHVGIDL